MNARRRGLIVLGVVGLAAVAVMLLAPPVPQDPRYHDFADQLPRLGIRNGWNVLSNLPFVFTGVYGLLRLRRALPFFPHLWQRAAAVILAAGMVLVALGSGYYHLAPDDPRLVWDRLPMSVVFMALTALVIGDRVDEHLGRLALLPLLVLGLVSAVAWLPAHDLRLYGVVQYGSAATIALLLPLCPWHRLPGAPLLAAVGAYAAAKVLEVRAVDHAIFAATRQAVSGHSLKHLFAAAATLFLVWMIAPPLFARRPRPARPGPLADGDAVFFVGNSLLGLPEHPLPAWVAALAASRSIHLEVGADIEPGNLPLGAFLHHRATRQALRSGRYRFWVLQGEESEPVTHRADFHRAVRAFDAAIRASGGRTVLFMTWAFAGGPPAPSLAASYDDIARELGLAVIPAGLIYQDASDRLIGGDGLHQTVQGTAVNAHATLALLTGRDPGGRNFAAPGNTIDDVTMKRLAALAWAHVSPRAPLVG
jgi:hypothetical protein